MTSNTLNTSVAAQIRAELGRQQLSQAALARRIGWTTATVSRRLRGVQQLSVQDVEDIARALGTTAADLIGAAA